MGCATPRAPPVLPSGFTAGDEKLQQCSLSETLDFPETWGKPLCYPPSAISLETDATATNFSS